MSLAMSAKKGENVQTNAGRCVLASELMHKRISYYLFANQTQRAGFPAFGAPLSSRDS